MVSCEPQMGPSSSFFLFSFFLWSVLRARVFGQLQPPQHISRGCSLLAVLPPQVTWRFPIVRHWLAALTFFGPFSSPCAAPTVAADWNGGVTGGGVRCVKDGVCIQRFCPYPHFRPTSMIPHGFTMKRMCSPVSQLRCWRRGCACRCRSWCADGEERRSRACAATPRSSTLPWNLAPMVAAAQDGGARRPVVAQLTW